MTAHQPPKTSTPRPSADTPSQNPGTGLCRGRGRALLSRRSLFEGAAAILTGIAAAAPRETAIAATKIPQKAAQYQDHPKGTQHCAICVHFVPPSSCQFVAGKISPNGWCVLFAAKPPGSKSSG